MKLQRIIYNTLIWAFWFIIFFLLIDPLISKGTFNDNLNDSIERWINYKGIITFIVVSFLLGLLRTYLSYRRNKKRI